METDMSGVRVQLEDIDPEQWFDVEAKIGEFQGTKTVTVTGSLGGEFVTLTQYQFDQLVGFVRVVRAAEKAALVRWKEGE